MPYGAPVEGADTVPSGPEQNRVPFNNVNYRNILANATNPDDSPGWTLTNATLVVDDVSSSPIGVPQTYRITTTAAGGTLAPTVAPTPGANLVSAASLYLQVGSGAGTARFTHSRTGGGTPIVASVDIDVATGQELARVEPEFSLIELQTFVIQQTTWVRVIIRIDDQFGNASATYVFTPDLNNIGGTARIQGLQLAAPVSEDIPPDDMTRVAYAPTFPTNSSPENYDLQVGALPRMNVDTRHPLWVGQTTGGFTWDAKFPEWHGTVVQLPANASGAIRLPSSVLNPQFPLVTGFYFFLDLREAMNSAVPQVNIQAASGGDRIIVGGDQISAASGTVNLMAPFGAPNFSEHQRANSMLWQCLHVGNGVWYLLPTAPTHGAILFDTVAVHSWCWPFGARVIYATGAAGGGGGASDGGGGGSGAAVHKQLINAPTGAWGTNFAVTVGAGGAGGAGGAAGAAGAATTISGALLTLAGGAGGNPSGIGGQGGVSGGAGGMNGQSAIRDAAVTMLLGGAGGGNIAGGVGGLPITNPLVSATATGSAGLRGAGGAGAGTAAGNGGNGGDGFVLIEW